MSEPLKVTGLIMTGVLCFGFAVMGEPIWAKTFGGLFGAILGLPVIGAGIQKLVR